MDQRIVFLTLLGMTVVTYVPRLVPLWFLSSRSLPAVVVSWLRHVPVAVLAAMLLPSILISDQQVNLDLSNTFLWACIPTLLVAWKTRSLFGSVVAGMVTVAVLRLVGVA
jgi:branched-subunit amino acid transport protein